MSIYLGIDIGTSGTKTLAINERGKILAQAMATYPCYHPKPLWSEQDPEDWWQATVKTVRAGGRAKLIEMVANPALTGFTAPKILWLRNKEPKNFDKTVKLLLPKDEIRRRLTGEFATEVSDASGMLLLDVVKRRWSKPLLEKLDLDADLFA